MKKIVIALVLLPLLSFQNVGKLVKTKFTENISGLIPENFFVMTQGDIIRRIPSSQTPLAAYTDEARLMDFSINVSVSKWKKEDINIAKDFFKASVFNLYDEVNLLKEEMKIINGKAFAVFEFESLLKGDGVSQKNLRKYTYIQYTIQGNNAYVFSFNSPLQLKKKWQLAATEMMDNVKMK
ncbi:MAG: hypothetical protein OEW67_01860 [Cyclobacteriaceae bacterium]|nr:hypothetical protein [Cyclobacteriaceae bacterium]